jgi:hypothetical protein
VAALTGPALVAAALLALAGAQKVVDPTMTVGALRALGLPSAPWLVRLGSVLELALGVAAIVLGGAWLWWGVALSYALFAWFVVAALRRGTMLGSCGCFGREETPPHPSHVVLNVALGAIAGATAVAAPGAPLEALLDHPAEGIAVVALTGVSLFLLHAAYVDLPRTLAAGR